MSIHDHSEIYSAIVEARELREQIKMINSESSRILLLNNTWADLALGVVIAFGLAFASCALVFGI